MNALDHSHHVSDFARRYAVSPLKGLQKYYGRDLISFAGGLPSPEYFPFTSISADILPADAFPLNAPRASSSSSSSFPLSWLWRLFGSGKDSTTHVGVPRSPRQGDGGLNLATALQYGPATGLARIQAFTREFTERIYAPVYNDWTTLVHTGNTDGWSRIARLLLNPGDTLLVEEWAYPSAISNTRPLEVRMKSIPMDGQGIRTDVLRAILSGWNAEKDGPRPRVLYTVPVGQNPVGVTMGLERKKAIYAICVEYDIIIAEDDPYFFLQVGEFVPKSQRKLESAGGDNDNDVAHFISSLVPSFLKVDTEGRVIRIDTFSKTIAPGVRLGWFTCSPLFAERLERIGETSTQSPCGLGQALVMALLEQWTFDGYIRWLRGLRTQYKLRRDYFVDCLADEFDLIPSPTTGDHDDKRAVLYAYARGTISSGSISRARALVGEKSQGRDGGRSGGSGRPLLSFIPPTSGMFVWVTVYFGDIPDKTDEEDGTVLTPERQFWARLADSGLLTAPGWFFSPEELLATSSSSSDRRIGHLRLSYTPSDMETIRRGVKIFAQTLEEFSRV
ncbi:PLP-dependent transferase [Multifurca ochricompacta]|uniref:PLP-dependent transferase n=1 Tax=Multifurca ochricompacta TaxID=376703 RepID=A0AAD4QMT5_9AGAM|nr:PLP-dependent transferase [Multifurca ochricompacta]